MDLEEMDMPWDIKEAEQLLDIEGGVRQADFPDNMSEVGTPKGVKPNRNGCKSAQSGSPYLWGDS